MKALAAIISILLSVQLHAQINAYARVSGIAANTLTISSSNETYATFTTGMQVIVMQMQDNVIGSNTSNNASFGTLSSIQSAGQYEVAQITSVTRSSGSVTQINLGGSLANTYNTGTNSSVQVISYPLLAVSNYSTTADITAVAWNGLLGGVVAFRVGGTLTLNHNISADNAGFRGGTINAGTAGSCDNATYITSANDLNANKGEGIYRVTNTSYAAGRARVLNGGGGGNSHNAGGGGGSNGTAGGEGGQGYNCTSNAGGLGGATLYSFISSNRAFMGGGAGAGEANNSFNTVGGNGGGIVLIKANQIVTTGTGSALRISANGQTAADVGNDGAGGGGAGGTVLLSVNSWNVASTKTLTISANGGSGGNVTDASSHGGGGGGGQGAIIFSTATPTTNITAQTLNGSGGRNYAGGTFADNAAGSNNAAIFNSSFAVLPVHLLSFKATNFDNHNELNWQIVNEASVEYFEVQRSDNGTTFGTIGTVRKSGDTYSYIDNAAREGDFYYRIVIHESNGNIKYTNVVMIKGSGSNALVASLTPNPVVNSSTLQIQVKRPQSATIRIANSLGMLVKSEPVNLLAGENTLAVNTSTLSVGTYHVSIFAGAHVSTIKMIVAR